MATNNVAKSSPKYNINIAVSADVQSLTSYEDEYDETKENFEKAATVVETAAELAEAAGELAEAFDKFEKF